MCILMYMTLGYFNYKESFVRQIINFIKLYICSLLSLLLLYVLEIIDVVILQYLFNFNSALVSVDLWVNVAFTIPTKLILGFIVYINYVKHNINIANSFLLGILWNKNFLYKRILYIQVVFNILLIVFIYNKFVLNNVLNSLEVENEFFIVFFIFITIIIETLLPWVTIASIKLKQNRIYGGNLL